MRIMQSTLEKGEAQYITRLKVWEVLMSLVEVIRRLTIFDSL